MMTSCQVVPDAIRKSDPLSQPYIIDYAWHARTGELMTEGYPKVSVYPSSHEDDVTYLQNLIASGEYDLGVELYEY